MAANRAPAGSRRHVLEGQNTRGPSSDEATEATFAESAAVNLPPSARENTMMAATAVTCPVCGNALSCRFAARIDS